MKVKILGSSSGRGPAYQFAISYTVNDSVAIDAGSIGLVTPLEEQKGIRNVFLSHTHIDHIGSLPLFLDNVYEAGVEGPVVYGSQFVLDCLATDVFNDRVWPNLTRLAAEEGPVVQLRRLENEKPVEVDGIRVTPVRVNHTVPAFGFIVEDQVATVVFSCDTGPTLRLWEVARSRPSLKAVFLEASFPDSMADVAEESAHLTPTLFAAELNKLDRPEVQAIVVHTKRDYHDQVARELRALDLPAWEAGEPGTEYRFH